MTDKNLTYEFAATGGGMEAGFNDGDIELFKGDPSYFLARESIQNILDAVTIEPAVAEFSAFPAEIEKIPDYKRLTEIMLACSLYDRKDKKAAKFYEYALGALKPHSKIYILRIDDFNTTGMGGGDDEREGDYHKFMKSRGSSSKDIGSGGSFGLGKAAYYAASNFRMIFVSSVFEEKGIKKYMFQGKLLLNSFIENGVPKNRDGSFGLKDQKPVRDPKLIPEIFRRSEPGTSIFVISFSEYQIWKDKILKSVLENFWPAIVDERLKVKVGDVEINSGSIETIMNGQFSPANFDSPIPYFDAYRQEDKKFTYEKELKTIGKVQLYTLLGSGLPKKTAYARSTGMIVKKKRDYYCAKDHVSFFYCLNKRGSEILKKMENPRHDDWQAKNWLLTEGIPDPDLAEAERELKGFIKEAHERFGSDSKATAVNIPNLEQYLYTADNGGEFNIDQGDGLISEDISDEETGSETGALKDELNKLKERKKFIPVKIPAGKQKVLVTPEGPLEIPGPGGPGPEENPVPQQFGTPDDDGVERKVFIPVEFRSFHPAGADDIHVIDLKDISAERAELEIFAMKEKITDKEIIPMTLVKAEDLNGNNLTIKGNRVMNLKINGSYTIKAKLKERGKYSLFIKAYEIR